MFGGHCVGIPIVAGMPHSDIREMKDNKDCDHDDGSYAEYFDPAGHFGSRCAAGFRSCRKIAFGV
jgi:hypothetical protein